MHHTSRLQGRLGGTLILCIIFAWLDVQVSTYRYDFKGKCCCSTELPCHKLLACASTPWTFLLPRAAILLPLDLTKHGCLESRVQDMPIPAAGAHTLDCHIIDTATAAHIVTSWQCPCGTHCHLLALPLRPAPPHTVTYWQPALIVPVACSHGRGGGAGAAAGGQHRPGSRRKVKGLQAVPHTRAV